MATVRKITVEELEVGMRVVDTGLSWIDHPYLFSREGLIVSQAQIEAIKDEGYLELFVEQAGENFTLPGPGPAQPARTPAANLAPYRQELGKAKTIYADSLGFARDFIREAKLGKPVNYQASAPLVEEVIASVTRNPDALVSLIKLRAYDEYTYTHCINVSVLAVVFGRYLGLDEIRLRQLGSAGLFHDLGKTGVPDEILNKPGRLTEHEFQAIKAHPALGAELLSSQPGVPQEVLRAIREHHEKFNGQGYPQGLKDQTQSSGAQILSLADVYDALTSKRVYKDAVIPVGAMRIMFGMRGRDFSPDMVDSFIKCLGIFPVGSLVRLKNGAVAVVCRSNPREPLLPTVRIVLDQNLRRCQPTILDLASPEAKAMDGSQDIADNLDHTALGLDPTAFLT
jgi:putative nucleotidyltransferase with HDIG domain